MALLEDVPEFTLQPLLWAEDLRGDRIALTCPGCGHLTDTLADFVRARAGDRLACGACGRIARIPACP